MELETTPAMKVAVVVLSDQMGTTWQNCSFVQELNWHKIHFIAEYFQIYQMLSADLYFTDLQHEERLQAKNVPSTLLKNRMLDCRPSFVL